MNVRLKPPSGASSPWTNRWYELDVIEVKFDLSANVNEHPIIDKTTFLFSQYLHPRSKITVDCILTADSDVQGSGIEEKKLNLIEAAAIWWSEGEAKVRTECAQIDYRGWEQYVLVEKLDISKEAGDEVEYTYTLDCIIHEGD